MPFAPLLAASIDAEVPTSATVDDLGAAYRVGVLREAASAVLQAAFTDAVVLVVEDAMWVDEASAQLLARGMHGIERRPWFVCLTTRDRTQGLSARLGFESRILELAPLDGRLAEHLGALVTDDAQIGQDELQELCARARGNPLFLLELAHARREVGSLDAIPEALEDLVAARIDRLAPTDRTLLRHAAVLGDRFSAELFQSTLGDVVGSTPAWHHLVDFIVADQGDLRFSHDLVRRVAYQGLPFAQRRALHLRVGRALVPEGEPDGARLGLLALHFDGSGDHDLAWRYNLLAGRAGCGKLRDGRGDLVLQPCRRERPRRWSSGGKRRAGIGLRGAGRRCAAGRSLRPCSRRSSWGASAVRSRNSVAGEAVQEGGNPAREARQALRRHSPGIGVGWPRWPCFPMRRP